ncbi:MAG: penicillin-binding protein 2 [Actinobacteria bacterium]|nr:penicillin-binding protein 2 [Actinomycetota bacterium]
MNEHRVRVSIVGVIALALFSALFARLWYLQVAASGEFVAAAQSNSVRTLQEPPLRGRIFDVKGRALVDNRIASAITIDRKITDEERGLVVPRLAELLGITVAEIEEKLDDPRVSPYTAVPIALDVPYETLVYVSEHQEDFPAVRGEQLAYRRYVNGSLGAHLLGYVGEINEDELAAQLGKGAYQLGDTIGKNGVEQTYESELRGKPGVRRLEVDSSGRVLRTIETRRPRPGNDVRLTIDLDIQRVAEESLAQGMLGARAMQDETFKEGYKTYAAPAGAVVVLDALDGSVVAMASNPTFDPNEFVGGIATPRWDQLNDKSGHFPLTNRALSGQYAPGSTWKLVTAIGGLQSGAITPGKSITDKGRYSYPTDPQRFFDNDNRIAYGSVNLARALTVSSDVFFYTIGGDLYYRQRRDLPGGDAFQETARAYGFGALTGIALPSEQSGRVPDAAWKEQINQANPAAFPYPDWLPGDNIQFAVGQGDVLTTPLQLANAYAAFGNGGTLFQPRVAAEITDAAGKAVSTPEPIVIRQVPTPGRAEIIDGLTGAVYAPKGTAVEVFSGFPEGIVSGKTGTAQVANKQNTSWFVGMTPAAAPRYVVLAVVEEGGYGAATAAPIVRRVMQAINGMPLTEIAVTAGGGADT